MSAQTNDLLQEVFQGFKVSGTLKSAEPFGSGHINDTYLVRTEEDGCHDYVLQRINKYVFSDIPAMSHNIDQVTSHIRKKLEENNTPDIDRHVLTLVKAGNNQPYYLDSHKDYWNAFYFIPDSISHDCVDNADLALQAGRGYGSFLNQLQDFSASRLHITIPDFHDIDFRLENLQKSIEVSFDNRINQCEGTLNDFLRRQNSMKLIKSLGKKGEIPERVTHNDTKLNNVLMDKSGKFLCVIDLGTVMPGYIHYDFGDAIRTICNSSFEDEKDLSKIHFNLSNFENFSRGYLEHTKSFLTDAELDNLAFSALFMTYIMGIRFLADYLDGDKYYKTTYPGHNLVRANAQLTLLKDMENHYGAMQQITLAASK